MDNAGNIVKKLLAGGELAENEYVCLLENYETKEIAEQITAEAVRLRKQHFGNKVYTRGLIEFTNYCKNDCYYCGIRAGNTHASRYRLSEEEILECCREGYKLGFRTFVLQGGEDLFYKDEDIVSLVRAIKREYPDCAVTLSIGEKSYESYKKYRLAGADRYLLRHETADEAHYRKLHPQAMSLAHRKQCLYQLKELGYQVGAGFMVGSPGQEMRHIARDLIFLTELKPQMVGIGPFIPHHDTIFAKEEAGSVELTLFLLSVVRILLPTVLLPATTALGSVTGDGRERGILAGANVVMPNLSPARHRKQYDLYDNKVSMGEEAAEHRERLAKRMKAIGYELTVERGDAPEKNTHRLDLCASPEPVGVVTGSKPNSNESQH